MDEEAWREEYRKKQAAGVKFECLQSNGNWLAGGWGFDGLKECYREVKPIVPHLAERALYWAQRAAGTNEVWQWVDGTGNETDIPVDTEPQWRPGWIYRVKPKTVKRYMAMLKGKDNSVYGIASKEYEMEEQFKMRLISVGWTIIGNIEEREVEL